MDPKVAKENQDKNQKNKMKALEYFCLYFKNNPNKQQIPPKPPLQIEIMLIFKINSKIMVFISFGTCLGSCQKNNKPVLLHF